MKQHLTKALLTIVALLAFTGCTYPTFVKPPDAFTGPSATGYYWPNFTADVVENTSGDHVVTWSAEQRSPDIVGAYGIVHVNGVEVFNANLQASAGTDVLNLTPGTYAVEVWAVWREATELLWTGWVVQS